MEGLQNNVWPTRLSAEYVEIHFDTYCTCDENVFSVIYSAFIEKDNTILLVPFKLRPVEHWNLIIMMAMLLSKH